MDRLRVIAAWIASLIYWVVGGTAFLFLWVSLPLLFKGDRAKWVAQGAIKVSFRGFVRLLWFFGIVECEYVGFDKIRAHTGPMIIAPNHPALWDAVFILAKVDHAACVLKASLMHNPILVGGATAAGFIPNEPIHKMMRQCIDLLKENGRLLFFPEGTRTRKENGCLNPFLGGLAIVAKNSQAPVYPIYVQTDSSYLSKGWSLWRLPPKKIHIRMTVGEPVIYEDSDDTHVFLQNLRQRYLTVLETAA